MAPGRTMASHSSHPEGLIIWGHPKTQGPWTFPLERWVNGPDGRGGPARAYGGRMETIEVTSRFHLPPVSPHLASRQLGAAPCTKGKFSVSRQFKTLTLEKTIEGNINTVDHGTVHSASAAPFPLTEFLFLSVFYSFLLHSSPTSLIFQALHAIFPIPCKGADDKN